MKSKVAIIGAGGHAKIVCDLILKLNQFEIIGFVDIADTDKNSSRLNQIFYNDYKIIATQNTLNSLPNLCDYFVVAIGDNKKRAQLYSDLSNILKPIVLMHPNAIISNSASIGQGTVVLANAIINSKTTIGKNCIINSGVVLDNDCIVYDHAYLKMGTLVGNNSQISKFYTSEMGQIIAPNSKLE